MRFNKTEALALLALRAGPLTTDMAVERLGEGACRALFGFVRNGLAKRNFDDMCYYITDAGRRACPSRREVEAPDVVIESDETLVDALEDMIIAALPLDRSLALSRIEIARKVAAAPETVRVTLRRMHRRCDDRIGMIEQGNRKPHLFWRQSAT